MNLLHYCDGQPFGITIYENTIAVECPTCRQPSSYPLTALMLNKDSEPTIANEYPFVICGYENCRQEFTIRKGVTTLPFGKRSVPRWAS
jgi:hypothetical protein